MKPKSLSWGLYVKYGIGRRLSMLGERLGIAWLTYNPITFQLFHNSAVESAPGVIAAISELFPGAKRYADIGAGTGAYAAAAIQRGIDTVACENSPIGRRWAARQGVLCTEFDLMKDPPADIAGPVDLAYCFEVAEHVPAELGDRLVHYLATLAPIVIFSAAARGQGGTGHINEQPKEYWITRFQNAGMKHCPLQSRALSESFRQTQISATWLVQNVMVFQR